MLTRLKLGGCQAAYSSMTELHTQRIPGWLVSMDSSGMRNTVESLQIGFGDVQQRLPRVKTLINKEAEVLRDAQLAQN